MQFDSPTAEEYALVIDAWVRSYQKSPWAGCVPNHLWDSVSRTCISEILNRGARIVVAVADTEDGGRRVMGYSVSEPGVLHWLFVKRDYRGVGVGSAILRETCPAGGGPWTYTHRTRASERFLGRNFAYDPRTARIKA